MSEQCMAAAPPYADPNERFAWQAGCWYISLHGIGMYHNE
jgi:hypothetical protein